MANRPSYMVDATPGYIEYVAAEMREEHIREVEDCGCSLGSVAALRFSFANSLRSYAVMVGNVPICVMGFEPAGLITAAATVWMLGTEGIDRHPGRVTRAATWGIGEAYRVTGAKRLEQWIPAWYRTGLRFVQRLGFVAHPGGDIVRVTHDKGYR